MSKRYTKRCKPRSWQIDMKMMVLKRIKNHANSRLIKNDNILNLTGERTFIKYMNEVLKTLVNFATSPISGSGVCIRHTRSMINWNIFLTAAPTYFGWRKKKNPRGHRYEYFQSQSITLFGRRHVDFNTFHDSTAWQHCDSRDALSSVNSLLIRKFNTSAFSVHYASYRQFQRVLCSACCRFDFSMHY